MSVNEKMTAIADNIREKTGGAEALTLDDMASGVNEVYEAGKKAQNKEFVDSYITYFPSGEDYMFGRAFWNAETFYPTKDFTVYSSGFRGHNNDDKFNAYDLAQRLEECGVKMTMGHASYMFLNAKVTRLPEIDFSPFPTYSLAQAFYGAEYLVTIDKLKLGNSRTSEINGNVFYNCKKLKNITIEGIINSSISFLYSPLSVESMKSIITHLKDFSGTTSEFTCTVTFKASAFEVLEGAGFTEEDKDWLTSVGQTYSEDLTWATVIDNLKWNLTLA